VQPKKPQVRGHAVLLANSRRGPRSLCRLQTAFLPPVGLAEPGGPPRPSAPERTQTLPAIVRDCSKAPGGRTLVFL
jgi:hypothetical protein